MNLELTSNTTKSHFSLTTSVRPFLVVKLSYHITEQNSVEHHKFGHGTGTCSFFRTKYMAVSVTLVEVYMHKDWTKKCVCWSRWTNTWDGQTGLSGTKYQEDRP
jgi:hypothetical protein